MCILISVTESTTAGDEQVAESLLADRESGRAPLETSVVEPLSENVDVGLPKDTSTPRKTNDSSWTCNFDAPVKPAAVAFRGDDIIKHGKPLRASTFIHACITSPY